MILPPRRRRRRLRPRRKFATSAGWSRFKAAQDVARVPNPTAGQPGQKGLVSLEAAWPANVSVEKPVAPGEPLPDGLQATASLRADTSSTMSAVAKQESQPTKPVNARPAPVEAGATLSSNSGGVRSSMNSPSIASEARIERFIICPVCKGWLRPSKFAKHVLSLHPSCINSEWAPPSLRAIGPDTFPQIANKLTIERPPSSRARKTATGSVRRESKPKTSHKGRQVISPSKPKPTSLRNTAREVAHRKAKRKPRGPETIAEIVKKLRIERLPRQPQPKLRRKPARGTVQPGAKHKPWGLHFHPGWSYDEFKRRNRKAGRRVSREEFHRLLKNWASKLGPTTKAYSNAHGSLTGHFGGPRGIVHWSVVPPGD